MFGFSFRYLSESCKEGSSVFSTVGHSHGATSQEFREKRVSQVAKMTIPRNKPQGAERVCFVLKPFDMTHEASPTQVALFPLYFE